MTDLKENPTIGTPLGNNVYKIRLAITSKNRGKSGGARVVTFVKIILETVTLISIYSKGEQSTLDNNQINDLVKEFED